MVAQCYQFAEFELEPAQRQLRCAGVPVELNSRYLDALQLLLQNAGKLVSKQQFFEQVWPGLVVVVGYAGHKAYFGDCVKA